MTELTRARKASCLSTVVAEGSLALPPPAADCEALAAAARAACSLDASLLLVVCPPKWIRRVWLAGPAPGTFGLKASAESANGSRGVGSGS